LFDVGIAGPLAGFIFIIPALIIGLACSTDFAPIDSGGTTYEFGEPLLFRLAAELFSQGGEEWSINLHPIGWAAWFGMLATGMNLLPIGQLDGGHVVYALLGRRGHRTVSYAALGGLVALGIWCFFGYLCFALILVFMGLKHPPPSVGSGPLERRRILAAIAGLLLLILTFIPAPVKMNGPAI
jgi:membrane-associated protease RseP (regulator of RpoE activity)